MMSRLNQEDLSEVVPQNVVTRHTLAEIKTDKPRVLIVEDDIILAGIVVRTLEKNGCQCEMASNWIKCIEAVKQHNYHLVLMDINMPEMNGIEATRAIRDYEEESGINTPIVAFTTDISQENRNEYEEAGMNGFIGKPFQPIDLEAVIRTCITLPEGEQDRSDIHRTA